MRSLQPPSAAKAAALVGAIAAVLASHPARADVILPAVFSDNMVLQRDMPVRIFGAAQPNEAITVSIRDGSDTEVRGGRALAGPDGRFAVTLEQLAATSSPLTMVVEGANTVVVRNVLVGEVWIAGGQSNMEWPIGATGAQAQEARAAAEDSSVRLLKAPHVTANRPQSTIAASWSVLSPQTADQFSAVAFWFAKDLRQSLGVPVGILSINWGGTRAEPWADLATLGSHARYEPIVAAQRQAVEQWSGTSQALRERSMRLRWADFQRSAMSWWGSVNEGDPGAKAGWYKPDYQLDQAAWHTAALPQKWSEDESLRAWDGVVWYRREVDLPAEWVGKELYFDSGPVDDCDVLYLNGRAVANTVMDWTTPRRYRIPGGVAVAGKNVIVLEILDAHGEGGLTAPPVRLICPSLNGAVVDLAGEWMARRGRSAEGLPPAPERPKREDPPATQSTDPAALFHGMISPFAGFAVRGAIWYQGESNAGSMDDARAYRDLLPLVVRSWRAAFERPDMPFGIVSLSAFRPFDPDAPQAGLWPWLRDAQLMAEKDVPNVGVVTTIDVGDAGDIHPRDKRTVGQRLARWARNTTYGQHAMAWKGPRLMRSRVDGNAVVLEFEVERPPLAAAGGGALQGFALAGADGVFHWAQADISSPTTIRVRSPKVDSPVEVRYAWQDNPQTSNVTDNDGRDGLPAHPFRRELSK